MPNILHTVPALFDRDDGIIGGAERYAFELARHMADEVHTTLLTFGAQDREERVGNLDVKVVGNPWYVAGQRTNPMAPELLRELRRSDVIHCHQQHVLASSIAALYGRVTGTPVFVTDLGGGGWDISGYISTDNWYRGHLHISDYSRSAFGHESRRDAHVILGGVDTTKFSPDDSVPRAKDVVFVGRLLAHKGTDYLIQALPDDLALHIIGQPGDDRYLTYLHELAREKNVRFHHDCDDRQLVDAYRRALCVVLPSVYRTAYGDESTVPELLGQTLLEGMSCGAAVISTDVASMPEIVSDASGFVVAPNDPEALRAKLEWLRDHPDRAAAMGCAGRERVMQHFTWQQVVRRCLDIYGLEGQRGDTGGKA